MVKKLGIILLSATLFTGCSVGTTLSNKGSNETTELTKVDYNDIDVTKELLANAKTIKVKKEFFAFNNSYDIYVNDTKVGNISGKFVNLTGDVFTFKTNNGYTLGSEKQIKRWGFKLNRLAEIKDDKDTVVGYIGEQSIKDMFKWGYNFHFYDADKNEIGYTKDIFFSLLSKFEVYDLENNKVCTIDEQFTIDNQYVLTIEDDNTIPVEQLVYFTCILDAIVSAEEA